MSTSRSTPLTAMNAWASISTLPLRKAPPYQTVLYWPGLVGSLSDTIDDYPMLLD